MDYLQLCRSTSKRAADNRQQEIAEISSGLKALAKELSLPAIGLAQLNPGPETRRSAKPKLSDLPESGRDSQSILGSVFRNCAVTFQVQRSRVGAGKVQWVDGEAILSLLEE